MLYGWKDNSMLTNYLAGCAHLSITVCEIERDICQKNRHFIIPPLHSTPPLGWFPSECRHPLWYLTNLWHDFRYMITDHVAKENHVINWSGVKILEREGHRKTRQVKESILIRKEPNCMNRDGGAYNLPTAYDRLLVTCSTSRDHKPDEARRWWAKRSN